jgi:mannose/fructose/N-acetylgalactosamine-specific phosphotransferase system component IIB
VDEVIGLLQDPRAERMKIFLLTDNPKDALKLVSALGLKNVNLGNYHNRKAEHTASVSMYVQLDRDDLGALKEISERVADAYVQSLPSTEKTSLKAFVAAAEKADWK